MSASAVDCNGWSSLSHEKVTEDDPRATKQTADATSPDLTVAGKEKGLTTGASAKASQCLSSQNRPLTVSETESDQKADQTGDTERKDCHWGRHEEKQTNG